MISEVDSDSVNVMANNSISDVFFFNSWYQTKNRPSSPNVQLHTEFSLFIKNLKARYIA